MSNKRVYTSYEEINRDLQILDIERTIHSFKARQGVTKLKNDLTLPNLIDGAISNSSGTRFSFFRLTLQSAAPLLIKAVFRWMGR